jgi:sugar O-acyltransferase (sialic acid O-acetyltransferase NeuD family)
METQYVIVGGGGFGREVACWAVAAGSGRVVGFLDDEAKDAARFPNGIPYLGTIASYTPREGQQLLLAIGGTDAKRALVASLRARGAKFASYLHPTAVVAMTASLGAGVVLCPYAVVSANAVVGEFVTINIHSSVGHDVTLGAYATLSAHVDLTGGVTVGEGATLGSGASVLPGRRVGAGATVGAGAVVMRNVPERATVYAAAAKQL